MFTEVTSLLNYRLERTVILNDMTQDKNKVLGDDRKKTVKLHRLERSTEESVYTFQSVVEAEQRNGGPQQKLPLAENENTASRSNQEQGMDKDIKIQKVVEGHPIAVGVNTKAYECVITPI